jgi:glycerol-3-phosphate dehydrogenase
MVRDLDALAARAFDVLVVGGGIYGLAIAYDAAQRGLSVALVERSDFGSGTSFNHHRIIHGGLRYLQTLDIARARESIRERRAIARIAPHTLTPLAFVLPLARSITRGATALRLGFAVDRMVGFDRNRGVPRSLRLPSGRVLGGLEARRRFAALPANLTGAAVWHDYVAAEADRLTLSFALAAAAEGALLANYLDVREILAADGRAVGAAAEDAETGHAVTIRAGVVVNATGALIDRLLAALGGSTRTPMLKAMNLVTRRAAAPYAMGGLSTNGRNLFLVPWRGRALFGTWESSRLVDPADLEVHETDVLGFLEDINRAFPGVELTPNDITLVHRGVVPARLEGTRVRLEGGQQIRDHKDAGVDRLISVAGTKYTTARAVAERVTDRVVAMLGRPAGPCRTAATPLGALGHPGEEALARAASVLGDALGWPDERRRREIASLTGFYVPAAWRSDRSAEAGREAAAQR